MPAGPASPTDDRRRRLLGLLADGHFHSGESLAATLDVSRSAIWKLVQTLRERGVAVQSVPRRGYRLPLAVDLQDREAILAALGRQHADRLEALHVLFEVDSTNRFLAAGAGPSPGAAVACVAELQTAGRGRRGRQWLAPFGSGICLSLAWRFAESPPAFAALSLAVGVAVVRVLARHVGPGIGLKWPNDILWQGRKLGGILIELTGETAGPVKVVIGVGLNVRLPPQTRLMLAEQQAVLAADLAEAAAAHPPDRNQLAAGLIAELVDTLERFAEAGFAAFAAEWRQHDALAASSVKVVSGNETVTGIARGIDDDGALLVDVDGRHRRFVSAEVSVRAVRGS